MSFYGYVHWRMTTEISVMYGSEKVKNEYSRALRSFRVILCWNHWWFVTHDMVVYRPVLRERRRQRPHSKPRTIIEQCLKRWVCGKTDHELCLCMCVCVGGRGGGGYGGGGAGVSFFGTKFVLFFSAKKQFSQGVKQININHYSVNVSYTHFLTYHSDPPIVNGNANSIIVHWQSQYQTHCILWLFSWLWNEMNRAIGHLCAHIG